MTDIKTLPATNNVTVLCPKLKYKEKFDKEMKGKRPQYDLKNSKIYQTLKDANELASEVLYSLKTAFLLTFYFTSFILRVFHIMVHFTCIYHAGEVQR